MGSLAKNCIPCFQTLISPSPSLWIPPGMDTSSSNELPSKDLLGLTALWRSCAPTKQGGYWGCRCIQGRGCCRCVQGSGCRSPIEDHPHNPPPKLGAPTPQQPFTLLFASIYVTSIVQFLKHTVKGNEIQCPWGQGHSSELVRGICCVQPKHPLTKQGFAPADSSTLYLEGFGVSALTEVPKQPLSQTAADLILTGTRTGCSLL